MAATQADAAPETPAPALQNGTERSGKRASPAAEANAAGGGPVPGTAGEPSPDYGQYRYEGGDYYAPRPGQPGGKPRAPPPQRFAPGPVVSQAPGQTPTLNSLLQAHRGPAPYPPYEQPPGPGSTYPPGPGWGPPRPMPPYNPQPYRNSTPPGARGPGPGPGPGPGGYAYGAPQQPPAGYPPTPYQRYPPPTRPPYSQHQGYERCGSPQPPHSPGSQPSAAGGQSPSHETHHAPHHPPHPHHQGYPPPRPPQPSTPNAHDPESELTGQNSNDSSGGSGGGTGARASTPHLRPTPSPTGSSGSRSMSPAVGQQTVPMPPRPSSSQSDGGVAARAPPAPAPAAQYPPHHPYKPPPPPPHYPPPPGAYAPYPRNPHPYPPPGAYPPYRHPAPHPHYLKQNIGHKMAPPDAMPPPTPPEPHDNNGPAAPPATAVVTTGPDGAPLDEASQQSTLSNASAASGEDSSSTTPKPRKEYSGGAAASPAAAHDDYDASPSAWPRPPSSPVFNSHVQQESFRSKKSDSLGKLYEMDESPERRGWVERLLGFMEERRTPIAACPTISKQPLDLYRLYLLVRDRGGFLEVTKNKTWKDIAGLLGIGASSSAAYTLRKHYTKNLLAYECHFDRGGIDPQPIINQVEATTKKKNNKANSAPSPGTSNTSESFPGGTNAPPGAPMDGYGNQYGAYPAPNTQPQGGGGGGGAADNNLAASNPFDELPRRPAGYQQGYGGYDYSAPYPPTRPVYPPYAPEGDRVYGGSGGDAYRYGGGGGGYGPRYPGAPPPPPAGTPPPQPYPDYYRPPHPAPAPGPQPPAQQPQAPPAQPIPQHEQYGGKSGMPPPAAGGQPRRHPDFAKEGAYAGGPRQQYPGWSGPPQQYPRAPTSPAPPAQPGAPPTWRPPPNSQPHQWNSAPYQPPGQSGAWAGSGGGGGAGSAGGAGPRPPAGASPRPGPPAQTNYTKTYPSTHQPPGTCGSTAIKRELMFPHDTVEATVPVSEKRRRFTRADVAPVDAWRIMMALKSGLLAETCWALDILNILLFDDSSISYFGLQHLPGLLDLLLEHFHKSLSEAFDSPAEDERPWYAPPPSPPPPPRCEPHPPPPDPADRVTLLSGPNYTYESRRGRPVTVKQVDDEGLFAPEPEDDTLDDAVLEPWQVGGDSTGGQHIVPCFRAEFLHIPFTRVLHTLGPPRERASPPAPAPDPGDEPPQLVEPAASPREEGDNLESEPMEMETDEPERRPELQVRDPAGVLKRRRLSDYEDECYARDEPSLNLLTEYRDALSKRCIALSNILRGLTFVPGNEIEFSRNSAFLVLAGKLLLLHHEHAPRAARAKAYERAARDDADSDACCSSLHGGTAWWWDTLEQLRSDALVCCANIAGSVELAGQPEAVARPLLDGLLHWCVCPAAAAEDAPPHAPASSPLSPRRLALEALCKLCVTDANVDLVLATPPMSRLRALCGVLARNLCRHDEQVLREFSVNLLHYLAGAESSAAREVALQAAAVSQLLAFIERAEQEALGVANRHGVGALRDNPDAMGTSLDMLRRAASTLLRLAEHPHNRALFVRQERRLLALVMSQILDQKVAQELARVLYHCSRVPQDSSVYITGHHPRDSDM